MVVVKEGGNEEKVGKKSWVMTGVVFISNMHSGLRKL